MRPEKFIENFSNHLKNTIARSISLASSLKHELVTPAHILFTITEESGSVASEILYRTNLDPNKILEYLESLPQSENYNSQTTNLQALPELDENSKKALEKAMLIAYERKHNYIGTEHLLYGIIKIKDKDIDKILKKDKVSNEIITDEIENILNSTSHFPDMENVKEAVDQIQDITEQQGMPPQPLSIIKNKGSQNSSALFMFTTNLTDKKNAKNFDPIIGREKEIERLMHILSRRTKNNPVLVGEPGVGKTAIVEGFAKRIAEGNVPDILKKKKVLSLDLTLLIAGTIYRGEFESRLKQIIDEISCKPDYILFIDELHNIIGAGSNQGTMDAANILKPALSRGLLRCIGATTIDEYKKHITSDPALERRFQSINVEEPTTDQTIKILKGIKSYYEDFHNIELTNSALESAVEFSDRYIHDNFLPDKAIDLIDEASALVKSKNKSSSAQKKYNQTEEELNLCYEQKEKAIAEENFDKACELKEKELELEKELKLLESQIKNSKKPARKKVKKEDVASVLSNRINIPTDYLLSNEWTRLEELPKNIKKHIVGQDISIEKITQSLHKSYLGLSDKKRPFASFLFAGPSGVGKTETAKVLAKELYQDEKSLIKLDMSEFSEQHSVSRLLGSPAGYVGYKERNRFVDELQKKPYAVLLFDEFDKAHIDVQRLLLQILDEGELTDSNGKKINLQHSIIILTTNLGSELYKSGGIGFDKFSKTNEIDNEKQSNITNKLKEELGTSLFSRIQTTCLFSQLNQEHVQEIINKNIQNLSKQLQTKQQLKINIDETALANLAQKAYSDDTGVRNADRIIQEVVHDLVIQKIQLQKRKPEYTLTKISNTYKLV
jgi:ATP-dependent Clp protease ATP-binding subunit ClpC